MNGKGQISIVRLRRFGRAAGFGVRSAFVAWIAILALIVQLGPAFAPQPIAGAGDADSAAALGALTALLGPNVVLCARGDASTPGSPSQDSHHCCDDCTLCQPTAHSAALILSSDATPDLLPRYAKLLIAPIDASLAKPRLVASAQPRAPPTSV